MSTRAEDIIARVRRDLGELARQEDAVTALRKHAAGHQTPITAERAELIVAYVDGLEAAVRLLTRMVAAAPLPAAPARTAPWQVGEADPEPEYQGRFCNVQQPDGDKLSCTLRRRHDHGGWHAALDVAERIAAVWWAPPTATELGFARLRRGGVT